MTSSDEPFSPGAAAPLPVTDGISSTAAAATPPAPAASLTAAEGSSDLPKSDLLQQIPPQQISSTSASAASASPLPPQSPVASCCSTTPAASSRTGPQAPASFSGSDSPSSSSFAPAAAPPPPAEKRFQSPASASPAGACRDSTPTQHPPPAPPSSLPPAKAPPLSAQQPQKTPPPRIVYDLPPEKPKTYSGSCGSIPPPSGVSSSCSVAEQEEGAAGGGFCCLDKADSHIDLDISPDGLRASCLHTDGFQYTWKGVRSTYGVRGASTQFYFEVKVIGCPSVVMPETPPATQNVCRIGVSQPLTSLFLGESAESWGYGGTAKKSHCRKFENYGQPYGLHDVVGVIVDLQNLKLSFLKNGVFLGTAYTLPARVRDTGLFPHLYLKNVDVQVNFHAATAWFPPPNKQIQFIGDLPPQALVANGVEHPRHVGECEFIMMVGLPACGKTFWAEQHCMRYPAKSYVLLGTNAVIDQMRVMGVKRQANYASRWEELMTTATAIFNALVARAGTGKNPRNIIIDQTNVYRNARRRKVQPFLAWGIRRAVTIVNDEQTLLQRTQKREQEEGKFVPVAAVKEMEAAFCLPQLDDGFTVIDYPELPEMESRQQVRWYNEDGRRFKRGNPNATGNQAKPHMEKRRPEEFIAVAELYPEKKRGRFTDDDQQPRQQYGGGGGGGAARGGWPSGVAAGRRDDCYADGGAATGGGQGRGQQQHWQQQQQQQEYYYSGPRGGQQQEQPWRWQAQEPQQDARGGGVLRPRSNGSGANSSYYEPEGHGNSRDYYSHGGQGGAEYVGGSRGGGAGDFNSQGMRGGGGRYYEEGRRGVMYHQQGAEGYFDGAAAAAAGGGGRARSYHVESPSSSLHGRTTAAAGSSGEPLAAGRGEAPGYYAGGSLASSHVEDRGNGGYAGWPETAAAGPAAGGVAYAGDSRSGSYFHHQQQCQSWGPGRFRGGGGGRRY